MRQKDPLRALSDDERAVLLHLSRPGSEAAAIVAQAKALMVVACSASYTAAGLETWYRSMAAASEPARRCRAEAHSGRGAPP